MTQNVISHVIRHKIIKDSLLIVAIPPSNRNYYLLLQFWLRSCTATHFYFWHLFPIFYRSRSTGWLARWNAENTHLRQTVLTTQKKLIRVKIFNEKVGKYSWKNVYSPSKGMHNTPQMLKNVCFRQHQNLLWKVSVFKIFNFRNFFQ